MNKSMKFGFLFAIAVALGSCKPSQDAVIDLPSTPVASFTVETTASPNKVVFRNTTPDAFLFKWDLGNNSLGDSTVVQGYYPFKGTYRVTLQAFNKGGYGSVTKDVVIPSDDPNSCFGNLQLLTNCTSKTWKLDPNAGALKVGPDAAITTVWWANAQADVAARVCQFNDEYTFTSTGTFRYDNKGDFWADTDGNGNLTPSDLGVSPGCQPATAWPTRYAAWNTGNHAFSLVNNQLTISGLGSWIGLYKVANGAEVTTPQSSVTYTIKEITATKLILLINFGVGYWQFTLVPK
jgi:hypothetical protein